MTVQRQNIERGEILGLSFKEQLQQLLNRIGYQVRRVDRNVDYVDPYAEQKRLLAYRSVNTVLEIGAADGRDSLTYASIFPAALVHTFEPVPQLFERLNQRSIKSGGRIVANNAAVSNVVGEASLNLGTWIEASSLLVARDTGSNFDTNNKTIDSIVVKTDTVDNYCALNQIENIDLLKMDAQGAELNILRGAERMLNAKGIELIFTEVQFLELYSGACLYHDIASYLYSKGFELHNLYGLVANQRGQLAWGDAIFVRSDRNA